MTGFSTDWLNLREDADRRARDPDLLQRARHWLAAAPSAPAGPVVVDLGAGTGATLRALSLPVHPDRPPLSWRLVDHDPALLAEARRRHGHTHRLETCHADLADVAALPLEGARLITASALFDLVSAGFLEALAAALRSRGPHPTVGVYAALNYDGVMRWTPAHPLDDPVLVAFNRDQRRDKGFGPALGPDAGSYLVRLFTKAGFHVLSARSPWVLDGRDSPLVSALVEGTGDAVAKDPRLDAAALRNWMQFRRSHVTTGACEVGHTDVIALPAAGAGAGVPGRDATGR